MVEHLFELIGAEKDVAERFEGKNIDAMRDAISGIAEFHAMLAWACANPTTTLDAVYESARSIFLAFFLQSNIGPGLPSPWIRPSEECRYVEPVMNELRNEIDEYRARFLAGLSEVDTRGAIIWLWEMIGRSHMLLCRLARGSKATSRP